MGVYNFANDNTLYSCGQDISDFMSNLKINMGNLLKWFKINFLKANSKNLCYISRISIDNNLNSEETFKISVPSS